MSEIAYRIRRSDRARRVRITVAGPHDVEVVLPRRATVREADEAVRELRPWIERRLAEARRAHAERALAPDELPYLDERLRVLPQQGRVRVTRRGDALLVPATDTRAAVERWYRRQARTEVAARLDRACAQAGLSYGKLTIRGQRTRWASCAANGNMSFNWRLLLAPSVVLDTVVWHEVCHLTVPNHSARFHAALRSRAPEYRRHEAWLRRYGATLTLDGLS